MKKVMFTFILIITGILFSVEYAGYSLLFDGTDFVNIGNDSSLNVGNVLTIEMWIKPYNLTTNERYGLYSTRKSGDAGAWQLEISTDLNNDIRIAITGVATWVAVTDYGVIPEGKWSHIVYTRSGTGTGTHKIYVNGVEQNLVTEYDYDYVDNESHKVIGSGTSGGQIFSGAIDEIRLWNDVRTQLEIQENMSKCLQGDESELVSYWTCDDAANINSGTILIDFTGTNEGTMVFMQRGISSGIDFDRFEEIDFGFQGGDGYSAWGDYDNDGDMDLYYCDYYGFYKDVYRNDSTGFTQLNLSSINGGRGAWGDYDNDGDIDLLSSGQILRNDSGILTPDTLSPAFPNEGTGDHWVDYDNDGDLDVVKNGVIWKNTSDIFGTAISVGIGSCYGKGIWGDYDNDGDFDVLSSHPDGVYRNDSGAFSGAGVGFTQSTFWDPLIAWCDYDSDGDLDVLHTGTTDGYATGLFSRIYKSNGDGTFIYTYCTLESMFQGDISCADYDNDGDMDVFISGMRARYSVQGRIDPVVLLYRNDSGEFIDSEMDLPINSKGTANWADYDNDGDLDFIYSCLIEDSLTYESTRETKIYKNNLGIAFRNTVPSPPTGLSVSVEDRNLILSFSQATDKETPQELLTYNIDLNVNGYNVISAMADTDTGVRRLAKKGNVPSRSEYKLIDFIKLPQVENSINWKIQTVDNCYAGSEFATGPSMNFSSPRDLNLLSKTIMEENDSLKWEYIFPEEVDSYIIQIDDDQYFRSPLEKIFNNEEVTKDIGLYQLFTINEFEGYEDMILGEIYYWRVKPVYKEEYHVSIFSEHPASFVYGTAVYSTPSPVNIEITGEFVTLTWNDVKDAGKGEVYNVYSSDDPYAVFPEGWTLEVTVSNGTQWLTTVADMKKFYCVTATGSSKEVEKIEINESEETKVK